LQIKFAINNVKSYYYKNPHAYGNFKVDHLLIVRKISILQNGSTHRHQSNIDCLMARTACLVCFISTVNGRSKKIKKEEEA
jgi:hypothetical protein